MEIMTIPTAAWTFLPSYARSFTGPVDVPAAVMGGACGVSGADGDAATTARLGADLAGGTTLDVTTLDVRTLDFSNKDFRNENISTKDIRPGSRAWSPPV